MSTKQYFLFDIFEFSTVVHTVKLIMQTYLCIQELPEVECLKGSVFSGAFGRYLSPFSLSHPFARVTGLARREQASSNRKLGGIMATKKWHRFRHARSQKKNPDFTRSKKFK